MTLRSGARLTYSIETEAWYANLPGLLPGPEILIHTHHPDGDTDFAIKDTPIGTTPCIRLDMTDDAFPALQRAPELFAALAERRPATLDQVVKILRHLGADDVTIRRKPADA